MGLYTLTLNTFFDDFGHVFEHYRINKADLMLRYSPGMSILEFGYRALESVYDRINTMYCDNEISKQEYYQRQSELEKEMFLLLRSLKHPQALELQKAYLQNELNAYNCQGAKSFQITTSSDACSIHLRLTGKTLSFDETWAFLSEIPKKCTQEIGCNIHIFPVRDTVAAANSKE